MYDCALVFSPSLLSLLLMFCFILPASCFYSINKSDIIFQYVVLIQNLSIFVTFVCMEFSCVLMINSFLFLVGLALYSLWAHIFSLCPKLVQHIWIYLSYALCSLCIRCTRVCLETIWTQSGTMWVSLVARVQAGLLRNRGLIPGRGISRQYLQFMQPPPIKCMLWALSSGLIWPVHEVNSSPPHSVEVTSAWISTSTPSFAFMLCPGTTSPLPLHFPLPLPGNKTR